jgi:NAD(P)H-hydrate repair Nnr-like enzyme with NAD(P)H-hydrate epimerase domain
MAPLSLYLAFYISAAKSVLSLAFARLYTPQSPPPRDLSDQIAIVTGGNSGIGLSIATSLAKQGATVYLACRNLEKGDAAVKSIVSQIGSEGKQRIFCWKLDTSNLDEGGKEGGYGSPQRRRRGATIRFEISG